MLLELIDHQPHCGQNILIKQMIKDFCAYFTPGGEALYVGDADTKWAVFQENVGS